MRQVSIMDMAKPNARISPYSGPAGGLNGVIEPTDMSDTG
jgi:ribulose 1,5-bisphosphate carboxylase large subunit-like protein